MGRNILTDFEVEMCYSEKVRADDDMDDLFGDDDEKLKKFYLEKLK